MGNSNYISKIYNKLNYNKNKLRLCLKEQYDKQFTILLKEESSK